MHSIHSKRFYRTFAPEGLSPYRACVDTTDLYILSDQNCHDQALEKIKSLRHEIESHIKKYPEFQTALTPVAETDDCTEVIRNMIESSAAAGTGPMASVAGAIAQSVGIHLLKYNKEIIVENGGDIWLKTDRNMNVSVYTNNIYFRDRIAIKVYSEHTPCGICTSSSKLGHSLSFGNADSVTVVSESAALADSAATEICNRIKKENHLMDALEFGMTISGVNGILALYHDKMAAIGNIELTEP